MINNDKLAEQSRIWVKENKKEIIKKFIGDKDISTGKPFTIFMAGSPGAGKTETSKRFISILEKTDKMDPIIRIDPDEIREIIPGYNGKNSDTFQGAASLGVEKLYDYVLKNKINAFVDGTLAKYDVALKNIARSIEKRRVTSIFYIYQDPIIAWKFTKAREKKEGRYIPKEAFIDSFFAAKENVNFLKRKFRDDLSIFLIEKNFITGEEKFYFNIIDVDNYLKIEYTKNSLNKILC